MDTALKAMQRAARAVLKPDLRLLRLSLKRTQQLRADEAAEHRLTMDRAHRLERECAQLRTERDEYRIRADKVAAWGKANRSGDLGFQCCAEYMQKGAEPLTYGAGQLYVNPFDRWQVSPAIR